MKIHKTKQIQQLHSFRHYKKKRILCDMYRDPMSLVPKEKNTITLKLKQVCATHRQQVHTGIAIYTQEYNHT